MMGPLWDSGQVFHLSPTFVPGLALADVFPGVACLWQMMSSVPKASGPTKPVSVLPGSNQAIETSFGLYAVVPW